MNNTKNIVVLVSGGGTNLQALIDAQARGELGSGKITCVISSKANAYALTRAQNNGIKTRTLIRKDYNDIAEYSIAMRDALLEEKADIIVYAGFMTILDENVCDAFVNRMVNVHPALIPSFCGKGYYGLHVHEEALKKGVKVSGATVHFVTAECDAGPIILQKAVKVLDDDTPETLQKRIMEQAEWKILPQAVKLLCDEKIAVVDGKTYIK
ncbi:MAG: phosphoribosylglycinamide formyltransferase [Clostridia bacterium]|nr:phosphoribosylglycinamide formyltransferase [Clostridia bacterium]